jgi:pimeloyl-ACP methyl ester carboxylesterase
VSRSSTHAATAAPVPHGSAGEPAGAPVTTLGRWFGAPERASFGWLSTPHAVATSSAVLILPPIGYEYWSAYRTTRVLAERLARAGHTVLRLDYHGSGDAAGGQSEPGRVEAWRATVALAAWQLRALGCDHLVIVGVRFGATIALLDARAAEADAVVAWEPLHSGRRFAREVRMLATEVPDNPGALAAAGVLYTAETLAALERLDLAEIDTAPAPRVLVLGQRDESGLAEQLRRVGSDATSRIVDDGANALEVPAEDATVPTEIVAAICEWVGNAAGLETPTGSLDTGSGFGSDHVRLTVDDGALLERVVRLGPQRLVGVLTEPASGAPSTTTVVFLSSGSESHIGPGRAWVEYARALAMLGHRCLRVDFRGWGESPDAGTAPGRPYDSHCEGDAIAIVRALRDEGCGERIVLVGLCAGAWVALRAALREPLDGVIALNPQLYWQPGDPVEALMSDTRVRRAPKRRREELGRRYGLWTALDLLGHRPWAGRWLDDLVASGTPTSMVFAEGDDGIEYLRNRCARRLDRAVASGVVRIVEVPGIDHSMHRVWLRGRMIETIATQIAQLTG